MSRFTLAALVVALLAAATRADETKLQVDADFPGGNVILDKTDGDTIQVHQDLRDTAGDWFYWHFRVRGGQGRKLTFQFTKGNPIGVNGPAVSAEGRRRWWCSTWWAFAVREMKETQPTDMIVPHGQEEARSFMAAYSGEPATI